VMMSPQWMAKVLPWREVLLAKVITTLALLRKLNRLKLVMQALIAEPGVILMRALIPTVIFFGPSTVTISCVREMIDRGYFAVGGGRVSREETVPEPNGDEAVIFEELFTVGLRMPPHPVLSNILLKF
jgi:hypothetical protein